MIVSYLVLIISFLFVASMVLGLQLFALLSKRLTQRAIQDTPLVGRYDDCKRAHRQQQSVCVCVCACARTCVRAETLVGR